VTAVVAGGPTTRAGRRPTDLRRYSRWLAVVLLPLGPAAIAVLRFVLPYATVDDPAAVTAKVIAHPGTMSLVLWLGFVAVLTLVPGVLAVGRLTRRRAPRITAAALLLVVPGYLVLAWLASSDILLWAGANMGLDAATLTRLSEATHPTFEIAAGVFVLGHVIGTVLLGLAMWRSRAVPRWAAVLTMVSQPLHFVAAVIVVSPALDLVGWGMNAVGFAAAAVAIARLRDDEWDLPPTEPA
jgi:Domain of unknown function (DUF4386)